MTLAVTVLGSAAMYSTPERACSGYLIETSSKKVWMDAGGGTWLHLQGLMEQDHLAGIVLTHRHPDHTLDLFQCFHARRYGGSEPLDEIPLWAPAETIDRLLAFSSELDESFDIHAVRAGDSVELGDLLLSFFEMAHPPETVGVRAESNGAIAAYSSDTGPDGDFQGLASGAQLLLCEATFQEADDEWDGHLTAAQAGKAAAAAGVAELVLTHLPDKRDLSISLAEAEAHSGGVPVRLASDGLRLDL